MFEQKWPEVFIFNSTVYFYLFSILFKLCLHSGHQIHHYKIIISDESKMWLLIVFSVGLLVVTL
jgi:hypothetical protein